MDPAVFAGLDSSSLSTDTLRILASVSLVDKNGAEYAFVPAGSFLMGSDGDTDPLAGSAEQPQRSIYLSFYWIGRTEVTNDQYAGFVTATGHDAPYDWENGRVPSGRESYPVGNVSWDDGVAFTEWLAKETGMAFRLCTEAEWEKACRGTDGRIYPWSDAWDESKANTTEGGPGTTTAVDSYSPAGDSPYGVADMAGNVWEWTSTRYGDYPYDSTDGREAINRTNVSLVARGGSFNVDARGARCAARLVTGADTRDLVLGLRVCVSPGF
jgi:formylglycine-generating enzyme required for sulfatase activity